MLNRTRLGLLVCLVFLSMSTLSAIANESQVDNLDKTQKTGRFPKWWKTWPFQRDKASDVYKVSSEDGRFFIEARDSENISVQIFSNFYWPIDGYPYLNWRWRAKTLPQGETVSAYDKNDSACGVYIVVGKYDGHAIKYVWSTSLPKSEIVTRRDGNLKISVLESGDKNLNKWNSESVNVVEEYQRLFGRKLKKNPSGIGILTDGNATHSTAACDYGDFVISDKPVH